MKIHLVDGTYELFRAHFGAPPKKAPSGLEIGATLGETDERLVFPVEHVIRRLVAEFLQRLENLFAVVQWILLLLATLAVPRSGFYRGRIRLRRSFFPNVIKDCDF